LAACDMLYAMHGTAWVVQNHKTWLGIWGHVVIKLQK